MSRAQNHAPRSWTESEPTAKRRPLLVASLFFLFIAAIAAFLWYLIPRAEQRVFAFGFVVEQSSERHFPSPAFPRWDLSGLSIETWSPWLLSDLERKPMTVLDRPKSFCERIENGPQLRDIPEKIRRQWKAAQASRQDTLIIYLRGLSAVTPARGSADESQLYLLAPEDVSLTTKPQGVSVNELIRGLTQVQAAQVVVLADIADLTTAAGAGMLENDIPASMSQIMQGLTPQSDGVGGTPVWLILPRAAKQPHHVSQLLRKTLMQSAAEYALENVSATAKQRHLPLTDFYANMLRYSHDVTGGTQTPILFRSGHAGTIKDTASTSWQEASLVHVAFRNMDRTLPDKIQTANRTVHFVSTSAPMAQDDRPAPGGTADRAVSSDVVPAASLPPGVEGATNGQTVAANELEKDPWLVFWQLRDALAVRKITHTDGWAPSDFAVNQWQEIQREALRKERLWRLSLNSDDSLLNSANLQADVVELSRQLEQAIQAIHPSSSTGPVSPPLAEASSLADSRSLSDSWIYLRNTLSAANNPKRAWLSPSLLASDLEPRWNDQRAQLRDFMDACSESAAWMELALESAIYTTQPGGGQEVNEMDKLRPSIYELADHIREFKAQLSGRSTLMDRPWDFRALNSIASQRNQLRRDFNRIVSEYQELLESDRQLTWRRERTIQVLLSSPLLSYPQRRSLYHYYSKADSLKNRLRRPGHENARFDSDVPLNSIMSTTTSDTIDTRMWNRKLTELLDGKSESDQWMRSCYAATWPLSMLAEQSQRSDGILLPISGDTRLAIFHLPTHHQLPKPLSVTIRHRNGTSPGHCWVNWKLANSGGSSRYNLEASLSDRTNLLAPDSPRRIDLSRDEFLIHFRPTDTESIPLEGISVQLRFAMQDSDWEVAEQRTVIIQPENPDRIDLFVKRWDFAHDRLDSEVMATQETTNGAILRSVIGAPAIQHQAKAQYQLYLCNRLERDREVRVRLYDVRSPLDSGNGQITQEAISRTKREALRNLQLLATVSPLKLRGSPLASLATQAGQLPDNATELILPALDAGPQKAGLFGLVLVIDDAPPENSLSTDILGKAQYVWMDCLSQTPCPPGRADEWLIEITSQRREQADSDFDLRVPEKMWNRWGLETLEVKVLLTDEAGRSLTNRSSSVAELSPQASTATLNVRPSFDSLIPRPGESTALPEKIVVHFSIGDYPRAASIEYRTAGGIPAASSQGFVWLDPKSEASDDPTTQIELFQGEKMLPVAKLDDKTFILPNILGVTDRGLGTPVKADRLSIPFRIDFPKVARTNTATVRLGSLTQRDLRHDRLFDPVIDVVSGRLSFSSAARDHRYEIQGGLSNASLRGRLPLAVSIGGTELQEQISMVFDVEKPSISKVELTRGSNLYEGGALRVEMSAVDEDSEISTVYFAINRERANQQNIQYDDQDDLPIQANFQAGRWVAMIKHESLAKAELLRELGSSYDIVARSVDMAGNVQDAHRPAKFYWQGKRNAPPSKPSR